MPRSPPAATSSLTGSIRNGGGVAITGGCAVVYLANQYALFGPVNADGTFTVSGIPSGTYALAFLGCDTGQPLGHRARPRGTGAHLPGAMVARRRSVTRRHHRGRSRPDRPARHAPGHRRRPGSSPATTSASVARRRRPRRPRPRRRRPRRPTAPTPPVHRPRQPASLTITITAHSRSHARSRSPSSPLRPPRPSKDSSSPTGQPRPSPLRRACTTTTGVTSTVQGAASPLTLTGVDDGATYSCVVAASSDGTPLGSSATVMVDPLIPAPTPGDRVGPDAHGVDGSRRRARRRPARGRRRQTAPSGRSPMIVMTWRVG